MIYYTIIKTPVGQLIAVAENEKLISMYWAVYKRAHIDPSWREDSTKFTELATQIHEYFDGTRTKFPLPAAASGTPFQQQVWQIIAQIPYGTSITYKDIAEKVGKPHAVRAVGTAVGSNPFSIIVPCHRVMASSGGLGGYAGGIAAKERLLHLEGLPHACRCSIA